MVLIDESKFLSTMVDARFYPPPPSLAFLVRQFETIKIPGGLTFNDKFIPRPDAALVFHFKAKPRIIAPVALSLPSYFVAPVVPKSLQLVSWEEMDSFIVCCHASVLSRVFDIEIPTKPYFNIPLDPDRFQPLWEQMARAGSDRKCMAIFEAWVRACVGQEKRAPDQIDDAYLRIVNESVRTPLSAIVEVSRMSASTLQRKFARRVGVTPKLLIRITRLNYLWDRIRFNRAVDYQDLVFEGHYFDQAHFIKDFKSLTGETPGFFFSRDQKIAAILSGRNPSSF